MAKSIFVLTNYDLETSYSAAYCQPVIGDAKNRHGEKNNVVVEGSKATQNEVLSRLKKLKPHFFMFSGHGTSSTLEGHNRVLLMDKTNCACLKDTIVFTRACDALVELGGTAVSKGCVAFIGYAQPFWGVATDGYASRPLQDPNAKDIYENSNVVSLQILKGTNVQCAVQEAHRDAAKRILRLLDSSDPTANSALLALSSNDQVLTFKGEGQAMLLQSDRFTR